MSRSLIELNDICKNYANRQILKNISLKIYKGETVSIIGKSGSGKSTLLNIMALFEKADSGVYLLGRKPIPKAGGEIAVLRNIMFGFVFQMHNLIPGLSVKSNIIMPLEYSAKAKAGQEEYFNEVVEALDISGLIKNDVKNLSGGEKQRVAIARAIINKPQIVFADEPTGNLDGEVRNQVLKLFEKINREFNITTIIVTHDESVAAPMNIHYKLVEGELNAQ